MIFIGTGVGNDRDRPQVPFLAHLDDGGAWAPTFPNATYPAGQLRTWTDSHRIDDQLRIRPAPGHTSGSSVVWLGLRP